MRIVSFANIEYYTLKQYALCHPTVLDMWQSLTKHYPIQLIFCKLLMRKFTAFVFAILAALAVAEKYAMVFGTADWWGNYSIDSVRVYLIYLLIGSLPSIHRSDSCWN